MSGRWGPRLTAAWFLSLTFAVLFTAAENQLTVALAGFNVYLAAMLVWLASGRGPLHLLLVTSILPGIVVSWPIALTYFAWVYPGASTSTTWGVHRILVDGYRLQLAVLVFLLAYAVGAWPTLARMRRRERHPSLLEGPLQPGEWGLTLLALVAITVGWGVPLLGASEPVRFVSNALRNYYSSLFFVTGIRWFRYSPAQEAVVVAVLVASAVVNTVANARGLALMPVLLLLGGVVANPGLRLKRRLAIVLVVASLTPAYTVLGNQTRLALGTLGTGDLTGRVGVMRDAVAGGMLSEQGGVLQDTFVRFFGTGGHAIIQAHWDDPSFERLDAEQFASELLQGFLPGFLFGTAERPVYTGSAMLRDYGFLITDQTSVEVSLIGSAFFTAGLPGVAIVGLLMALINCGLISIIGRGRPSLYKVVIAAGMVLTNFLAFNVDIIQISRSFWWMAVYQGGAYFVLVAAGKVLWSSGRAGGRHGS